MFTKTLKYMLIASLCTIYVSGFAKINVLTTTNDLASITETIGGSFVTVNHMVEGYQDPHFVDAKPSFILKANQADLFIYVGADLEIGYLPNIITNSRNSKIQTGKTGNLNVSEYIQLSEIPLVVDRSKGDVHPQGNPHYMLDPRNGIVAAQKIADRLSSIDPSHSKIYKANVSTFIKALKDKIKQWESRTSSLKGAKIVSYHKYWNYLYDWLGLVEVGTLEPIPGIKPSPKHLAELAQLMLLNKVKVILQPIGYYPSNASAALASKVNAHLLLVPGNVGGNSAASSYTALIDQIIESLVKHL